MFNSSLTVLTKTLPVDIDLSLTEAGKELRQLVTFSQAHNTSKLKIKLVQQQQQVQVHVTDPGYFKFIGQYPIKNNTNIAHTTATISSLLNQTSYRTHISDLAKKIKSLAVMLETGDLTDEGLWQLYMHSITKNTPPPLHLERPIPPLVR